MNFAKYRLIVLMGIFYAAVCFGEENSISVRPEMVLWEKGYNYASFLSLKLEISGVKFKADAYERNIEYNGQDVFATYSASMRYETSVVTPGKYEGAANRTYTNCEVINALSLNKGETLTALIETNGFLDRRKLEAKSWFTPKGIELKTWNGPEKDGKKYYRIEVKPEKMKELARPIESSLEIFTALSGKSYLLTWTTPMDNKCKLQVTPIENGVSTKKKPSGTVIEVIERESSILYNALCSGVARNAGETWEISGEQLKGFIHPSLQAEFDGNVWVKAEEIKEESTPKVMGAKIDSVTGLKLRFISSYGEKFSRLTLRVSTRNGTKSDINFDFDNPYTAGEIWLDSVNQVVVFGKLSVKDASYKGSMPEVGDLARNLDCNGRVNLDLLYLQSKASER